MALVISSKVKRKYKAFSQFCSTVESRFDVKIDAWMITMYVSRNIQSLINVHSLGHVKCFCFIYLKLQWPIFYSKALPCCLLGQVVEQMRFITPRRSCDVTIMDSNIRLIYWILHSFVRHKIYYMRHSTSKCSIYYFLWVLHTKAELVHHIQLKSSCHEMIFVICGTVIYCYENIQWQQWHRQ